VAATNALIDLRGEKLPADVATIRYEAREAISFPYEVDAEFSTEDAGFKVDDCLRSRLVLSLIDAAGGMRHFDGIVERAEFLYFTGTRFHFRVRLRPTLAALARREGCKIYQDMSVVDVVKDVFAQAGVDKVEWHLLATYGSREFIVQYRESELAFVHRLLESEGIFYFFRQSDTAGHTLILADDPSAFIKADDAPEVEFSMAQGSSGEPLAELVRTRRLRTTSALLRDFDFEKPQTLPEATQPAKDAYPMPFYEYPGGFTKAGAGQILAKARVSERRRDADTVQGSSRAIGLRCGVPFSVDGAAQDCLNGEFVVVELRTFGEQTRDAGSNTACQNEFQGIPAGAPYAPARKTPKPKIRGIQTAVVTGPSTAEQAIHVDTAASRSASTGTASASRTTRRAAGCGSPRSPWAAR
jgi:type VI secretion system secreted protein VgrG